jgi:peroxiredoxin family protein/rhodanese-related sulfurtransferase/TusA-related sulfurtransferase
MAALIHQHFKEKEVALYLGDGVDYFEKRDDGLRIVLASGKEIDADFVIQSVGVKPDIEFIKKAGIETGERGGIKINEFFQTNYENIYAVGDCIEYPNPITGISSFSYLAGPANKQGRMLADNLAYGNKKKYTGSIGTAIAKLFDITVGITGVSEKTLKSNAIPHFSTIINAGSHAGYYPDAMPLTIKITFSPKGKLLGGQVVGYKGVDKRVDLLAAIIKIGGSVYDLQEIEHSYAPPFSSAKDPVNQIGFNAENILNNMFKPLSYSEFHDRDKNDSFVLDVRTPDEIEIKPIKGAYNIELDKIRERLNEIPKNKKIYVFCGVGLRGYVACRILTQKGYEAYNLSGGLKVYEAAMEIQSNEIAFKPQLIKPKNNIAATDNPSFSVKTFEVDACGLQCPGPIMKLKKEIDKIQEGERIKETSTDVGFFRDVKSWCEVTGNKLINVENEGGKITAIVEKSSNESKEVKTMNNGDNKTIVVFSDDLDKALASFVIANGAASMGKKVTMFFTFWGLNIIKKQNKPSVKKDFMGRMFSWMMPTSSKQLKLSKMNMMGMGTIMMRKRMKNQNVDPLETMIENAIDSGVNLIGCQMSMDVMGVKQEELIEAVEIGGVANYLHEAESANVNLFI